MLREIPVVWLPVWRITEHSATISPGVRMLSMPWLFSNSEEKKPSSYGPTQEVRMSCALERLERGGKQW